MVEYSDVSHDRRQAGRLLSETCYHLTVSLKSVFTGTDQSDLLNYFKPHGFLFCGSNKDGTIEFALHL